ncbi:MAG: permease [Acidobacteriales bacterium]|nr:permease [Terriglobales bacterium]
MTTSIARLPVVNLRCHWRPIIMAGSAAVLFGAFWFASRYPQLFSKAEHVGQALPSMAYSSVVMTTAVAASASQRILATAVNWLAGMGIGMSFGVLLGALLHTVLRYYPLPIGNNLYLNSLKGALVGVPGGICANCSVPVACGVTRGHGRIEVALGFLFSSPNFNPVVVMMTFMAFPLAMSLTKYAILLFVILVGMPSLIRWLERKHPLNVLSAANEEGSFCPVKLPAEDCEERFLIVLAELAGVYGKNVWMLLKPTLTLMLLASVMSAALLVLVPWDSVLSEVTPLRMAFASLISVFMPVPIAMDVMFAAQLQQQAVPSGYVMMFAMTLGTYSIIPSIYLWREVSKALAVSLFAFFLVTGWVLGMVF